MDKRAEEWKLMGAGRTIAISETSASRCCMKDDWGGAGVVILGCSHTSWQLFGGHGKEGRGRKTESRSRAGLGF